MFGYAASVALVPFTVHIGLLIALVSVVGFFAQLYRPAAGAMLVDVLPADQRVLGFAVLRLAINVGMAIGPAAGGLVSQYSYTYIFLAEAVASATFGVLSLLALRETRPEITGVRDGSAERPAAAESTPDGGDRNRGGQVRRDGGYLAVVRDRPYLLFLAAMVAGNLRLQPGGGHPAPARRRRRVQQRVTGPRLASRPVTSPKWRIDRAITLGTKQSSPVTW